MNTISEPVTVPSVPSLPSLEERIHNACQRIPPLWPLQHFVAVNPFLGLSHLHFIDAAKLIQQVGHGDILMPAEFYLHQIQTGRIGEADIQTATALARESLPGGWAEALDLNDLASLKNALKSGPRSEDATRVLTFADFVDPQLQTAWGPFMVEEISKWCSVFLDQGQSSWRMPWQDSSLFQAWKSAARWDANPELNGLSGFRSFVASLPDAPLEVIQQLLPRLRIPATQQMDFLHRQLMSIPGWSSYMQYLVRTRNESGIQDDSLVQLLAIRLIYDAALMTQYRSETQLVEGWSRHLKSLEGQTEKPCPSLLARYVAQQAFECHYQDELISDLQRPASSSAAAASPRPLLQAVFCIDVRSEVYRRSLESQSNGIETLGFAGFFGIPMSFQKFGESQSEPRCPVLLQPKFKVRETLQTPDSQRESALQGRLHLRQKLHDTWNSFKTSAISCFSFVETAGLSYGPKLVLDSLGLSQRPAPFNSTQATHRFQIRLDPGSRPTPSKSRDMTSGIRLQDQVALAAGALKNMGLTTRFARVILICGHASTTANNPYGAALDCGACGGHSGEANARVAATLLNQPSVRTGLVMQGIHVPPETIFIAGLHNTTTDEVVLFDTDRIPADRQDELNRIQGWIAAASGQTRRERGALLGLGEVPSERWDAQILERSRDWAQVRPEWGLAGNAAFIAAPRERTQGLNLKGRVFLHNYHASRDPEKATLELIMIAPMVVASWINLQYYGSTVNNRLFGSGNKAIHNVVGTFGVWQGNGGDLQTGLPMQSLHDGTRWIHEPIRLNVFIEADCDSIAHVLAKHTSISELVNHGWISLFAMDATAKSIRRYNGTHFVDAT